MVRGSGKCVGFRQGVVPSEAMQLHNPQRAAAIGCSRDEIDIPTCLFEATQVDFWLSVWAVVTLHISHPVAVSVVGWPFGLAPTGSPWLLCSLSLPFKLLFSRLAVCKDGTHGSSNGDRRFFWPTLCL